MLLHGIRSAFVLPVCEGLACSPFPGIPSHVRFFLYTAFHWMHQAFCSGSSLSDRNSLDGFNGRSVSKQRGREVTVSRVGKENDDCLPLVLRPLGQLNGGPGCSA